MLQKLRLNNWMYDFRDIIKDTKFRNLCIPATHDSGTYELSEEVLALENGSSLNDIYEFLAEFPSVLPPRFFVDNAGSAINKLSKATSKTILEQLNEGIRGLDLRIHYDDGFYIHHGLRGTKLNVIIEQILQFLSANTGEIIYMTVGHFQTPDKNGFTSAQYTKFVAHV